MAEFLYAHTRLITALFYAVCGICLALYAIFFALALRPKRGTLEWIALYDRPGLQLGAARHPLRPLVLLPALGAAILTGALYCLAICLQLRSFELFRSPDSLRLLLTGAAVVALTACGGCLLLQSLFGSYGLAFAGAMLFGLDLGADYAAVACLVWSLFFLHRWMAADFEQKARRSFPALIGLALMLSLCATLAMDLIPLVFFLILAVVLAAILRLKRTHRLDRFAGFFGSLILFALSFLAGLVLLQIALTLRSGNAEALRTPLFYLNALLSWLIYHGEPANFHLLSPAVNLPLCALGAVGLVFSLYDLRRYGKGYGLLLLFAALGGIFTALLCGVYILTAALIPAAVYTFARAAGRDRYGLAAAGLIGAFVSTLIYTLLLAGVF